MPNSDQSIVEGPRTNSEIRDDSSGSTSGENCGVHTNAELSLVHTNHAQDRHDDILADLTAAEYRTLQDAYDWFNLGLFNGELPQVLITLQRHHRALGYFSPKRFQSRGRALKNVHEVALNPDAFYGNSDKAILSILAHEMVHVWQEEYGHPGRNRYHNREWAGKMCIIGLMPSATGRPGGAVTGESMSHYIMVGAEFDAECDKFLDKCRLAWESAPARPDDDADDDPHGNDDLDEDDARIDVDLSRTRPPTRQTRLKFTCPICGLNAWAKPDAEMACIPCSVEARELIRMLPNDPTPVRKAKLPIQSVGGATVNALAIH